MCANDIALFLWKKEKSVQNFCLQTNIIRIILLKNANILWVKRFVILDCIVIFQIHGLSSTLAHNQPLNARKCLIIEMRLLRYVWSLIDSIVLVVIKLCTRQKCDPFFFVREKCASTTTVRSMEFMTTNFNKLIKFRQRKHYFVNTISICGEGMNWFSESTDNIFDLIPLQSKKKTDDLTYW